MCGAHICSAYQFWFKQLPKLREILYREKANVISGRILIINEAITACPTVLKVGAGTTVNKKPFSNE
jgi:oligoribonuclease (3'-5' exoribonuclease)